MTTRGYAVDRRRLITIAAAVAGALLLPRSANALKTPTVTWRGIALGAPAMLTLQHPDEVQAKDAIIACLAEIARLEAIFSLHRTDSALMQLNVSGRLDEAPADLRSLLAESLLLAARTEGAFDPTIQPVWQFHARNTDIGDAALTVAHLEKLRPLVDWQNVHMNGTSIHFAKPGMALTLNGIAQGYITDRVGDVLRERGFKNVLVDIGEQLAIGPKLDNAAWRVGLRDPKNPDRILEMLDLTHGAVATSSNDVTSTDPTLSLPHILDPKTGRPSERWASITVVADRATCADGLSTALMLLPRERWPKFARPTVRIYAVPEGTTKGFWA